MEGYVYLIGNPTYCWYKIGKSKTPDIRIKNLGILLPFRIEIFAIWKSDNHSTLEQQMHRMYAHKAINGEWFLFLRREIREITCSLPGSMLIYPDRENARSVFSSFSNLKSDCPEGYSLKHSVKKMRGNFTPDQREEIRIASMIEQAKKKIAEGKTITEGQRRVLEQHDNYLVEISC